MKKTFFTIAMLNIAMIAYGQQSVIAETTDGKVGIGTTNPKEKLDVYGKISAKESFELRRGTDSSKKIADITWITQNNGLIYNNNNGGYHAFKNDISGDMMRIAPNGNLGVGTTTPMTKLDVNGSVKVDKVSSPHTSLQIGHDVNDRIIADNYAAKNYGGGMFFRVTPDPSLNIGYNYIDVMSLSDKGNVGIGRLKPNSKLDVNGSVKFDQTSYAHTNLQIGHDINDRIFADNSITKNYGGGMFFRVTSDPSLNIGHNYIDVMMITDKGKVGIGTGITGNHKLAVEGSIGAREIKVEGSGWSDFVFAKEYKLPTLTQVEKHIKEKGHLQNIPSAAEVKKDGFFLGEMDAKLLQKIEELTLYTIQQEKQLKKQSKSIKKLEALVDKLLENKK